MMLLESKLSYQVLLLQKNLLISLCEDSLYLQGVPEVLKRFQVLISAEL